MPDTEPTPDSNQPAQEEPVFPTLTWSVFRAKENMRRTILAVGFILAVVIFVAVAYHPMMALLAILVFALALNSYFLPTTYTFDQNGITTDKTFFRYTRRWSEFRGYIRTTGGVVISPFRHWTYLDNFRGLHLLLPQDPEPVLKYLADRLSVKQRPSRKARPPQSPSRQ
jgi:hypothetical protein